jgi:hypothetical protein
LLFTILLKMSLLYLTVGIFIFFVTAADLVKTTLSSNGGGVITFFISKSVWKAFFTVAKKNAKSKILEYAGVAILLSTLLVWVIGMWIGIFLTLPSDQSSVQSSSTLIDATPLEKLYFAGYCLFTLGNGDFKPTTDEWRLVTNFTTFSGLAFITTSITYFIPVLSAVNFQSKLSLYIHGMGKTPEEIVTNSWNGTNFSSFIDTIPDLGQMLMQHSLNHHSYPVIHYFHNSNQQLSIILSIGKLEEAYHILTHKVVQNTDIDQLKFSILRTALDHYIETVKGTYTKGDSKKDRVPSPNLKQLAQQGIPLVPENENALFNKEYLQRREDLSILLENNGWTWKDVYNH